MVSGPQRSSITLSPLSAGTLMSTVVIGLFVSRKWNNQIRDILEVHIHIHTKLYKPVGPVDQPGEGEEEEEEEKKRKKHNY